MERELINWLRRRLPPHPALELGLGDDAAIVRLAAGDHAVLTTDILTEGVDFNLSEASPALIGRKSLAVNLSDLAAMAAQPLAALVGLVLPRGNGLELAKGLYEGLLPLAKQYQVSIAGGDTNSWDGPLVISITAVGQLTSKGALTRSGAKPGDRILVTGSFGGSILGHQFNFEPRVSQALWLHRNYDLHAGIDVSDGLSLDLSRLAAESGCGAVLDLDRIPISPAAAIHAEQLDDGSTALDHALADGEDFELILAVGPEAADRLLTRQPLDCRLTSIGHFVPERGLWHVDHSGKRHSLSPRGYEHA